jgi:hypothetical protein
VFAKVFLVGLMFQSALHSTQFDLSPEEEDVREYLSNNKRKGKSHLVQKRQCRLLKMDDCTRNTHDFVLADSMHALSRGVEHGLAEGAQFDLLVEVDLPVEVDKCGLVVDLESNELNVHKYGRAIQLKQTLFSVVTRWGSLIFCRTAVRHFRSSRLIASTPMLRVSSRNGLRSYSEAHNVSRRERCGGGLITGWGESGHVCIKCTLGPTRQAPTITHLEAVDRLAVGSAGCGRGRVWS